MKLLAKPTIDVQKQKERKIEIDEGVKLATSIDEMRRLKAQEETNLTEYRNNALRAIQSEIDAYITERNGYAKEVIELQTVRQKLLKPLDEEWLEINGALLEIEEGKSNLLLQKSEIDVLQVKTNNLLINAKKNLAYSAKAKKEAHKNIIESVKILESATNEFLLKKSEHDIQTEEYGRRLQEIELMKATYQNGVNVNEMEENRLKEWENELIIREQDLARRTRNLQAAKGVTHAS